MKLVFSYSILVFFLASCASPRYYTPNVIVTPTFKQKGDVHVDLNTNLFNKASLTVGKAFKDHLGAYFNLAGSYQSYTYYPMFSDPIVGNLSISGMGSIGIGYYDFKQLRKFKSRGYGCFGELALGRYAIDLYYPDLFDEYHNVVDSGGIFSFGGNILRGAIVLQKLVKYDDIQVINSLRFGAVTFPYNSFDDELIKHHKYYPTAEYGLSLVAGKRRLKFFGQYNLVHCFNSSQETGPLQNLNFSLNFGFIFNPLKKR